MRLLACVLIVLAILLTSHGDLLSLSRGFPTLPIVPHIPVVGCGFGLLNTSFEIKQVISEDTVDNLLLTIRDAVSATYNYPFGIEAKSTLVSFLDANVTTWIRTNQTLLPVCGRLIEGICLTPYRNYVARLIDNPNYIMRFPPVVLPSLEVRNVTIEAYETSLEISWEAPDLTLVGTVLEGYDVKLVLTRDSTEVVSRFVATSKCNIEELVPFSEYNFTITAITYHFVGEPLEVTAETKQGVIDTPAIQLDSDIGANSLMVRFFDRYPEPGIITGYEVTISCVDCPTNYNEQHSLGLRTKLDMVESRRSGVPTRYVQFFIFRNLEKFTTYRITWQAVTVAGLGVLNEKYLKTLVGLPPIVSAEARVLDSGSVEVSWDTPFYGGVIDSYEIVFDRDIQTGHLGNVVYKGSDMFVTLELPQTSKNENDDGGDANLMIRSNSADGSSDWVPVIAQQERHSRHRDGSTNTWLVIFLVCLGCILAFTAVLLYRRRHTPEQVYIKPEADEWELSPDTLIRGVLISEGYMNAQLYAGVFVSAQGSTTRCAMKVCAAENIDAMAKFVEIGQIMKQVCTGKNDNVIRLYGTIYQEEPMTLVMEYCSEGDLQTFLRRISPNAVNPPMQCTKMHLLGLALGVADGMAYLSDNGILHRGLCASNILVALEDKEPVAKISSLSKAIRKSDEEKVQLDHKGLYPVRWMAPETFTSKIFNENSEVWSFGVVLWEIFSYGATPYVHMRDEEVFYEIVVGYRLGKPKGCPDTVSKLMKECWDRKRPTFAECIKALGGTDTHTTRRASGEVFYVPVRPRDPPPFLVDVDRLDDYTV